MAIYYNIRHYDPIRKKWQTTRDKMTEVEAQARYAGSQWEVVQSTKEERKDGVAPTLGRLYRGHDER